MPRLFCCFRRISRHWYLTRVSPWRPLPFFSLGAGLVLCLYRMLSL